MKRYFLTLGILVLAGVASRPALADTFFFFNSNDTSSVPCTGVQPCGEVTLTTSGNTVTFTVSSLDGGYVFDKFGFNFTGTGALSISGTPTGEVSGPSLGGSGNEDGWGSFDFTFLTGENGGSHGGDCVVTPGTPPTPGAGCTFSFTLVDSLPGTLTTSEFESLSSGGSGSGDFAGHVAASGASGYVGDALPSGTSPVPEPSSLLLLGTGALGAAGLLRRRFAR